MGQDAKGRQQYTALTRAHTTTAEVKYKNGKERRINVSNTPDQTCPYRARTEQEIR